MSYKNTLQAVDTEKALSLLGIEFKAQGGYAKFNCPKPDCDGQAAIKAYGDKKIYTTVPNANQAAISLAWP
jgi:hypothetical protein